MAYNTWMGKVTIRIYLEYSMLCNFHKRKCAIIYTAHFVTNDVQLTKSKAPTIASHCRQHTTVHLPGFVRHPFLDSLYTHNCHTIRVTRHKKAQKISLKSRSQIAIQISDLQQRPPFCLLLLRLSLQ